MSPLTQAVRDAIKRSGLTTAEVARQAGISRRRLTYLVAGERRHRGKGGVYSVPVLPTKPELFILEALRAAQ